MASRSVQEIEMEVPSFQATLQVKKVQKIRALELAKSRKILMDKQEQARKIRKENVKAEIEKRKREKEEQKRMQEEKKNKEETLKLNSEAKELSKDLKKISKNLKKVSKDLKKEAFFTVCEPIVPSVEAPPVHFSIYEVGESSQIKETVFEEFEAPLVLTDFLEVKEERKICANELAKENMKAKKGKGKNEKEKKNNKLSKDLQFVSTVTQFEVRVLDFSEYYNSSFLLAMEDLEKVHLEEAKLAEESRLGNNNSNELFEDYSKIDEILDNFDAPQWVDLSNLNEESDHFDDHLGFFCRADCCHTQY